MAECIRFVCPQCSYAIESWSDGNPYYFGKDGKKAFAYHPNHDDLARCVGNDVPYVCLKCATTFLVDSNSPQRQCPKCKETSTIDTCDLDGELCPSCHRGKLSIDTDFHCIS